MPFNGSGAFSPPGASFPAVASTLIESAKFNDIITDIATGLSTCLTRDGQSSVTSNLPINGFKLTGVGAGTARTDAATLASIQDGTGVYVATVGGTGDAITLTPSPAIAAYAAGQTFRFIAGSANTTATTVAVSGLVAKAVTKNGTTALSAGDLPVNAIVELTYDGTRFILTAPGQPYLPIIGGTLTGNLLFTDASYDIGATGATRPRDLFLSRNASIVGTTALGTASTATGLLSLYHASSALATTLKAGNATAAVDYVLPTAGPTVSGRLLASTTGGVMSWVPRLTAGAVCVMSAATASATSGLVAHGLGGTPDFITHYMECVVTEAGYTQGMRIYGAHDGGGTSNYSVMADSTNTTISMADGGPMAIPLAGGAEVNLTAAKWSVVAVPYRLL
jgi:hypothetical protein